MAEHLVAIRAFRKSDKLTIWEENSSFNTVGNKPASKEDVSDFLRFRLADDFELSELDRTSPLLDFCVYNSNSAEVVHVGCRFVDPKSPMGDREHLAWVDFFNAIDFEFNLLTFTPDERKFMNQQTEIVADWILETGMAKLKDSEVLKWLKKEFSGDILYYELASWLSFWIKDVSPLANQESIYSQILALSLDEVDYLELAELVINS